MVDLSVWTIVATVAWILEVWERSVTLAMEDQGQQVQAGGEAQGAATESNGMQSLMQQLLDDPSHDYRALKYGDVIDGTVMQRDRDEFLVDIGSKSEGIIPSKEYSTLSADELSAINPGDQVLVFVVQAENADGHTVLSIDKARQEKSWRNLQEQYDKNEVIARAGHQLQQGWPVGEPRRGARLRPRLAGDRDPRRRRRLEAGRHGPPRRHAPPVEGHRDQPASQSPHPLRADGRAGAPRRDEGAADREPQGRRNPDGARLLDLPTSVPSSISAGPTDWSTSRRSPGAA